jgi:peptidoglycan-N-acetylglucosamine deacetylase
VGTGRVSLVLHQAVMLTAVLGVTAAMVGPVPAAGAAGRPAAPSRPGQSDRGPGRAVPGADRRAVTGTGARRIHPARPLPEVRLASPDRVAPDAPVTLAFSVPVDTAVAQRSFRIHPAVAGVIHWPDPLTLAFQPLSSLPYDTTYEVSVSAPPAGASGPEGGGRFTFATRSPAPPSLLPPFTLTFDDCGSAQGIHAILDALANRGLHATFFPTGMCRDQFPWLVPTLIAAGHRVCNHTYSHPVLPRLSNAAIATEIRRGVSVDCNLLRPPYGALDQGGRVASVAASLGYRLQLWDVDTRDWAGTPADVMVGMIRARGGVVLFHMHGAHTVEAIREL